MKIGIHNAGHATPRSDSPTKATLHLVGRATPCAPLLEMLGDGAHGVTRPTLIPRTPPLAPCNAFTLIEVLIAVFILAMVMAVVHSVFYGALQLRNKTDQAFGDAIPLQHALTLIKRDLANLTVPGGTLTGTFQTSATTGSGPTTSATHSGQQAGPSIYTTSGATSDSSTWSEMQKVAYYLTTATNGSNSKDLIRSVTRNLLPVAQSEYVDQRLLGGVENLTFQYYNGSSWVDTWDSTTMSATSSTTNTLPQGIRVLLTLAVEPGKLAQTPIEMVVPVSAQSSTNATATSTL